MLLDLASCRCVVNSINKHVREWKELRIKPAVNAANLTQSFIGWCDEHTKFLRMSLINLMKILLSLLLRFILTRAGCCQSSLWRDSNHWHEEQRTSRRWRRLPPMDIFLRPENLVSFF